MNARSLIKNLKTKVLVLVLGSLGFAVLVPASARAVDVGFTNVWLGKITPGSGHIGVDITWPVGSDAYNPCHQEKDKSGRVYQDMYYGACQMSNADTSSYYKVMHFDPNRTDYPFNINHNNDFPYGIFIDNKNENNCLTASWCPDKTPGWINHGWANLVTDVGLEIYADDPNNGGLRLNLNSFPNYANGGRYSNNLGDVSLPQLGQPGVGKLNGFVYRNKKPVGSGLDGAKTGATFAVFQNDPTSYKSSTGYPLYGFAAFDTNSDGYYTTGPVPSGKSYKIYLTDNSNGHKVMLNGVSIIRTYESWRFDLDKACFGHPTNSSPGLKCTDPAQ